MITLTLDLDMPERCSLCPFCTEFLRCMATYRPVNEETMFKKREDWCPLKEKRETNEND